MTKKILEARKKNPQKLKKGAQKTKPVAATSELNRFTFDLTKGMKVENIKTVVSIEKSLLKRANALARKMNTTRNRVIIVALTDLLLAEERLESQEKMNALYAEEPDEEEKELLRRMRKSYRRLVEGQW